MRSHQPVLFATVVDNQDPDAMGRVKLRLAFLGSDIETHWLPVMQPFASNGHGAYFLPDIDDRVLVTFLDPHYTQGIVLGSVWDTTNQPAVSEENGDADLNSDGANALHMLRSKSGNRIILDDTEGAEKIQLLSPEGTSRFEIDAAEDLITIQTEGDITITAAGNLLIEAAEIAVTGTDSAEIEGGDTAITTTSGDLTVESSGNIALEGGDIALN